MRERIGRATVSCIVCLERQICPWNRTKSEDRIRMIINELGLREREKRGKKKKQRVTMKIDAWMCEGQFVDEINTQQLKIQQKENDNEGTRHEKREQQEDEILAKYLKAETKDDNQGNVRSKMQQA